jgi:hypothetical protein
VKERERKIATIQNQCRWLRGVESLELQKVARAKLPLRGRGSEYGADAELHIFLISVY